MVIVGLMEICPSISDSTCRWNAAGHRRAKYAAIRRACPVFTAGLRLPVRSRLTIGGTTPSSAASTLLLVCVMCIKKRWFCHKRRHIYSPFSALYMENTSAAIENHIVILPFSDMAK